MNSPLTWALAAAILIALCPSAQCADDDAPKPMSERDIERMHKRNKREAESAWARDKKQMKRDEFAQMETDYQEINDKYRNPEIVEIIERFLKKYKKGNRVGCAKLYLAQKTGSQGKENILKEVIKDHSDAYYLNGCSVGGLARLHLAAHYKRSGDDRKAKKMAEEIEKDYATAQDQSGKPIVEQARALVKED
jgi:hypothetical protein